ncbi:MAG TPA: L,D-transpeptidase family protein [Chitinophagaceae bacterium]|nr:L,D-transpeptidase family protein [Chitinophagaceae bacterium]
MHRRTKLVILPLFVSLIFFLSQCKNRHSVKTIIKKEIVKKPEQIDDLITDNIKNVLDYAADNNGKIDDSITLHLRNIDSAFYARNDYHNFWSVKEKWLPLADSMIAFIQNCKYYGLYPSDYHFKELDTLIKKVNTDTLARKDVVIWTKADLMLTDAFMKTAKDLKEGRILPDSLSMTSKPKYIASFFVNGLNNAQNISLADFFNSLQPTNDRYQSLKDCLKNFVDSMDTTHYQYIYYPQPDTLNFLKQVQIRLSQSGIKTTEDAYPDSIALSNEIKEYESLHKIKKDGKLNSALIARLNSTDNEKLKRIAITLDRYKLMPDSLPEKYIWVNLPGYYLDVVDSDSVVIHSRIIIGKPLTPTPTLSSKITDMITYPQWTIPESIIKKEVLPGLKKDPDYLTKKGYNLIDSKGQVVDAANIKWSKYKNGIPWKVMQGSGDDNALGIFKFNFYNPYSVYLHDTNQRYLFGNSKRALSHGCVRVQQWEKLAYFIANNDSMNNTSGRPLSYGIDSIKTWLADKVKKTMYVRNKLPLFIQYFTCEAKDSRIVFYDDIYNNDQDLAEKYFANK